MLPVSPLVAWAPLLFSCHIVLCKNIPSFAGPYIGFAHRFDVCPSDGTFVLHVKNSRFNPARPFEKQKLWGNSSINKIFDDSFWLYANMAIRNNNEWKQNAFIFRMPSGGCSVVREHIPSVFHMFEKFLPALSDKRKPCRIPVGKWHFENESVSWDFPHFKVMPYGHYRATINAGKEPNIIRFCMELECEVIPKPA